MKTLLIEQPSLMMLLFMFGSAGFIWIVVEIGERFDRPRQQLEAEYEAWKKERGL